MGTLQPRHEIDQAFLKELLTYNPRTGFFTWKARSPDYFLADCYCKRWNTRYAGKIAGTKTRTGDGKSYVVISIFGTPFKAHRLAFMWMCGYMPTAGDHENGIGTDNRWLNLRDTDFLQNSKNQRRRKDNSTGCTGVNWSKRDKKYIARICVNYKQIYLGFYEDLNKAIEARKEAEVKYGFHKNHGTERPL